MTIDERLCVTVQAISPVQEIGISHVGQAVFVIEPDRQQAIVIQCLSAGWKRKSWTSTKLKRARKEPSKAEVALGMEKSAQKQEIQK